MKRVAERLVLWQRSPSCTSSHQVRWAAGRAVLSWQCHAMPCRATSAGPDECQLCGCLEGVGCRSCVDRAAHPQLCICLLVLCMQVLAQRAMEQTLPG